MNNNNRKQVINQIIWNTLTQSKESVQIPNPDKEKN